MELLEHTTNWVRGEVFQGKIMLLLGLLALIGSIAILKSDHAILKGAIIPLGLMTLILVGYGGFQLFGRPGHIKMVSEIHANDPAGAIEKEYKKAIKDDSTYAKLKPVWAGIIAAIALMYFFVKTDYLKGLSLGLVGLFLLLLILDTVLHYRLKLYLEYLNEVFLKGQ